MNDSMAQPRHGLSTLELPAWKTSIGWIAAEEGKLKACPTHAADPGGPDQFNPNFSPVCYEVVTYSPCLPRRSL
jgi:hypothetical protein